MTDETLGTRAAEASVEDELTLGAATPDLDELDAEDVTGEITEEDYDFGAFVEGSRSTRLAVRPAMRGDLLAEMDTIVMQVEDAEKAGASAEVVDGLVEKYTALKDEFESSRRRVVVEARSSGRRDRLVKRLEREGLQRPGKKSTPEQHTKYTTEVMLALLADQIVFPTKGLTVDALRRLLDVNEPALNLIYAAAEKANKSPAKVVTPDFLRGR